ncbi:uncharacterized protein LOC142768794 [Rhipicephalus microplus]|uniref:uncharacterized protein LOC142768794 n=1 Tax=Rhipicephalus microplus TaxID=6941 RepID=UPI003F6BE492
MPAKTPFSEDEKDLVQDLVLKYKAVIENKRTDAMSINAKTKAWEKLCTDFNCRPFVRPRDVKQLKKLWDNMKQRWKREKAKQIRDVLTTGGGPPPPPMDERLAQIEGIVPHLTTRVPNHFDSDQPLATPAAQSASEILNGLICENGPADSDEDQTEELSQTDRAAMQSMLQSSHTPSVVGEDSLCLDDPKVDADMSQEEGTKPGAQSEAPTAGSSVRNVRGGRLSLLQHTLDVELEAHLDAIKADKKHKEIEHNQRMECMREEHEIKISTLKEQRKIATSSTKSSFGS